MFKEQIFDPTGNLPREILREYNREALEKTLEGEACRVLGEWRPNIPDNQKLSMEEETELGTIITEQFREWLKTKGLYPRAVGIFLGHHEYPDSNLETKYWHRDGIDSEDRPDKIPTPEQEEAGTWLKIVWSDTDPTDLRFHDDKTIIQTKPYQVVAVNNRLVDHRTPLQCSPRRNFITAGSIVPIG